MSVGSHLCSVSGPDIHCGFYGATSWGREAGTCLPRAFDDLSLHYLCLNLWPKGTLHHVQVFTLSACLSEHMTILLKSGIIKKQ